MNLIKYAIGNKTKICQGSAGIPFPGKIGKEMLHFLPILMGNGKTLIISFPFHFQYDLLFPFHFLPTPTIQIISFPLPSFPPRSMFFLFKLFFCFKSFNEPDLMVLKTEKNTYII